MPRFENQTIFSFADVYPNANVSLLGTVIEETSTAVVPDAQEQDAMGEVNAQQRNIVSATKASTKNIFVTLGLALALVIFLGGVK